MDEFEVFFFGSEKERKCFFSHFNILNYKKKMHNFIAIMRQDLSACEKNWGEKKIKFQEILSESNQILLFNFISKIF